MTPYYFIVYNKAMRRLFLIFSILLAIPAFFFLLKPGMYWNMHDDMQMVRQLEMEKCLKDGQIPCRWTPDLGYGYGYPLFNFYPPMPYFVGQIYRTFGLSYIATVRWTAITQIILSALFMYLLAENIFGPVGGLLSSVFYTYAPYHLVNIYIRGAMNEAWASVFFPLILYFIKKLIDTGKNSYIFLLGLAFSCLMLSHNPMVLIFSPIALVWGLFWLYQKFKLDLRSAWPTVFKSILSAILAFSLAAFFTLPVLLETKYVQVDSMFTGYYTFSIHYASLKQLFVSNFWGDGPSVWGPNDGMSFSVGYAHWILTLVIIIWSGLLLFKKNKNKQQYILAILIGSMAFFSAFMLHERSTFIWLLLKPVQKLQFPWRFLNTTSLLMSLTVGFLPIILKSKFSKKITYLISTLAVIIVIIINFNYIHPIHFGPITDAQKFSGKAWTNQVTGGIYDYLPKTAKKAATGPAPEFIDSVSPEKTVFKISGVKKGTDWIFGNINLSQEADVIIAELSFPNFKIINNGVEISYKIDPTLGRIVVHLPAGNNQIYLKLQNTPIRIIANLISLSAWFIVSSYFLTSLWKKLLSKK